MWRGLARHRARFPRLVRDQGQLGNSGEDQAQRSQQRKNDHQPFENGLVDFAEQPAAGKYPRDHAWRQQKVQSKARAVDKPQ